MVARSVRSALLLAAVLSLGSGAEPSAAVAQAALSFVVTFDRDSAELSEAQRQVILEAANRFRRNCRRCTQIEIVGHASPSEAPGSAMALSHNRAEEVVAELLIEGLAPQQMLVRAVGAGAPAVPAPKNEDEEQRNRRVVLMLR
jgi:outer membrane protein OmpA-like peptidoglycan-associated protein